MPVARLHIALVALAACKDPKPEPVAVPSSPYNEPTILVDHQPGPSDIAIDATHIYWTHFGKPLVRRMPRAGGPVETLYEADGEIGGQWLALDADGVMFSDTFNIRRVAKTGGAAVTLGAVLQLPVRFAADADSVYSASGAVMRHPKAGAELRIGGGGELWDVAVDATHVYWLDRDGVFRAPKAGGAPQQLAHGVFRFGKLAVGDTDVYWGDAVLESIFAVPKAGGTPRFIAHAWGLASRQLTVDGNALWVMQSGGTLQRIDLAARTVTTVAVDLDRGGAADHWAAFALAPDAIYVAAGGQSLVGSGPVVVDLTDPNAKLPAYTYDGAILKLPATLPPKATSEPAGDLAVAWVYFNGKTVEFQDPANATRWIEGLGDAYPLKAGSIGLRLVASVAAVSEPVARERANKVEALIRAQLGDAIPIHIVMDPATTFRGDVRVVLDEPALLRELTPR